MLKKTVLYFFSPTQKRLFHRFAPPLMQLTVRKSMTYGQLAAFKVNTEKSSIGFIQCFPRFSDITLQKMKLSESEASFHF